jgi:hypothetical protein
MKLSIYFLSVLLPSAGIIHAVEKKRLSDYGANMYSQFGEDGIVKKIFDIIGTRSKVAVEFGAWDGFHLSNTAALWAKDLSWKAILIEGDASRFKELIKNTAQYNVLPINAWVGIDENDCLETLLKKHRIDQTIDILSIDIDGNDYHIFESLKDIRPRLVIVEYNPTIPVEIDVYAPYAPDNNFGQSVAALNRIAEKKGYKLVALTVTNAFYVLEDDFKKFSAFETDLRMMNVNSGFMVLVTTYDGEYALIKNKKHVYFYGVDEQFRGDLKGDFTRCDTRPLALIPSMAAAYKKSGA